MRRPGQPGRSALRAWSGTGTGDAPGASRSVRDVAIDVVFAVALGASAAYGLVVLLT